MGLENTIVDVALKEDREGSVEKKLLRVEELSAYMGTPVATLYNLDASEKDSASQGRALCSL